MLIRSNPSYSSTHGTVAGFAINLVVKQTSAQNTTRESVPSKSLIEYTRKTIPKTMARARQFIVLGIVLRVYSMSDLLGTDSRSLWVGGVPRHSPP